MRFEFADKAPLVVVETRLNNKGPFKFVVDTGSSVTVVGREATEVLGISQTSNSTTSGCYSSKMLAVASIQVGGIGKRQVPIALGDLSKLSEETGTLLDGIIGSPFMKDYEVVIDYPQMEILFEESRQERRLPTKFRLVSKANFIVVETELNGKGPFNFLVDTGATKTVMTEQIGQTFGLHGNICGEKKALSGFFAGTTMVLSKVKSIQVGKAKSSDVEVGVQDLQLLCDAVGAPLDGVLGYTFMKDYRVTINYPKREMSFEKEDASKVDDNVKEVK
ncbi:MAG: retroviral-like aspartic protease family protein [Candidatus Bathyarchaeota archaeon]|nr:retroviral-like aspartic protease family protein [Candidatus Bathyarchaeota archaeon]MDH5787184.1 retroviral-like aspartic protease family protein [Candidatus Bathyarchaeota archaeon]